MKFVLAAIGSKYIHRNLAIHSLRAYAQAAGHGEQVETAEYTINQNTEDILADLYGRCPDAVGFSCYIWNISMVRQLAADLHQILPKTQIWLGGPEVSYHARKCMEEMPFLTGIMVGEGEETFVRLLQYYDTCSREAEEDLASIDGIVWRKGTEIFENGQKEPMALSSLPFICEEQPGGEDHRIIYYESSRGCPFSCSYCLSSIDKRLRFRDPELVERELGEFLERRVPQVKFVDRTFNCSHAHALRIWQFIREHDNGVTNFHFEVSADLLNEEELELLCGMRPGLVQLEIGVQSVNPHTLREIRRTMDLERLARNVKRLSAAGNIHLHLDLIAGLPWEDYESFGRSFDWVYGLAPENLQLGFLKVLKGSRMYDRAEEYGLLYGTQPPYEVLKTRWISYEELCRLKQVEKVLEIYYNSGQFSCTMKMLGAFYDSPFSMYEELAAYFAERGLFDRQIGRQERFAVLWEFLESWPDRHGDVTGNSDVAEDIDVIGDGSGTGWSGQRQEHLRGLQGEEFIDFKEKNIFSGVAWREVLVYDYYLRENAKVRPDFAPEQKIWWPSITEWYAAYGSVHPELEGYRDRTYRQLLHMTHGEVFSRGFVKGGRKLLVIFDYQKRNPLTGNARTWEAEEWTQISKEENGI